ncbi:Serine--tRNA ligase [bioreactor metagenome]|uniref:Serine--tRNA ligase n=1 Tax=bioreactor metagenome TaxID=1076179 RepID=A0A645AIF7_9ZZZZ
MLDIRFIKENAEYVKRRLLTRNKDYGAEIDLLLSLDTERRALISDTETKKAKQNTISKQIPALKKAGEDTDRIFAEMKELSDECKADTDRISEIDAKIEDILLFIPNLPDESVPVGPDDSANVVVRSWG